jgi:hypothetical protein
VGGGGEVEEEVEDCGGHDDDDDDDDVFLYLRVAFHASLRLPGVVVSCSFWFVYR